MRPSRFADSIKKQHGEMTFAIALEFWKRVTMRTPVRHGVARANWHLTMFPSDETTESSLLVPPSKPVDLAYPVFYVQNALDYIVPLEYGHSNQAPMGMFRVTVEEFR